MESKPLGFGGGPRKWGLWTNPKAVRENGEEKQRQGGPRAQGKRSHGVKINKQVKWSVNVNRK